MASNKPNALLYGGNRRRRWYPHEALRNVATAFSVVDDELPWEILDPEDARRWLPQLRENAENLTRFVAMIEAIAEGRSAAVCPSCGKRFYPLRRDARFCTTRCRVAAHRAGQDRDPH